MCCMCVCGRCVCVGVYHTRALHRFNEHSIVKELESNPVKFVESSYEEGRSEEQKEDLVEAPPPHNRQDSSSEEEEEEYS